MSDTVKIKAIVGFQTTMLGSVAPGQVIETKPSRAAQLIAEGRAAPYSTKVVERHLEQNSPVLQAGQLLPDQTAKESKTVGKQKHG